MNRCSGSKPVAGKIGNLVLKQTARAPSLGLPLSVKLSSLKVRVLFRGNFPVTAVSILFPLSCHLQRGRGEWGPHPHHPHPPHTRLTLKCVIIHLRNVSERLQPFSEFTSPQPEPLRRDGAASGDIKDGCLRRDPRLNDSAAAEHRGPAPERVGGPREAVGSATAQQTAASISSAPVELLIEGVFERHLPPDVCASPEDADA